MYHSYVVLLLFSLPVSLQCVDNILQNVVYYQKIFISRMACVLLNIIDI
jgi:hypothetical protein